MGSGGIHEWPVFYKACHDHDEFVTLTDAEINEAANFGSEMYESSQERGLNDRRPEIRNGVDGRRVQMLGSVAERACSKALGIEWTHWMDTFRTPDLHHNIEVRLIGVNHYGLRVYDKDHDSRRVVGVVIEKGKEREAYRIPGWINAIYGKKERYKIDPHNKGQPVYAVPQDKLQPLDTLKFLVNAEKVFGIGK